MCARGDDARTADAAAKTTTRLLLVVLSFVVISRRPSFCSLLLLLLLPSAGIRSPGLTADREARTRATAATNEELTVVLLSDQ